MRLFDLHGRVAIVTGGNGGIGLGIATGLVEAGASVAVAARNKEKTAAAVAELNALGGGSAIGLEVDVTSEAQAAEMVARTVAHFGRLDILVNNAGIGIRRRPEEYSLEEYQRVIDTNLTAAFVCCQAAYPEMKKAGGGKIINIGSMTSLFGHSFSLPYTASKMGIVGITRCLAISWAADNIQANAILPGWIETDLTARGKQHQPDLHQRILNRTPADRWGVPADLAGTAIYLASSASDFVTGASIPVDGGYAVQMP